MYNVSNLKETSATKHEKFPLVKFLNIEMHGNVLQLSEKPASKLQNSDAKLPGQSLAT